MDDAFRNALEAALAAKRPVITDEMRADAIRRLIIDAMNDDPDAQERLLGVAGIFGAENPDETVAAWIEEARQELRDICASVKGPVIHLVGNEAPAQEWPSQHWRGPPDRELPDREPATAAPINGAEVESSFSKIERHQAAERLRERQQRKYQSPFERALGWLK